MHSWVTYQTPQGIPYYYNFTTGITQWQKPDEISKQEMAVEKVNQKDTPSASPQRTTAGGAADDFTLFVFHLPEDWNDTVLQTEFSRYGTIVSASVMYDKQTKESRGFGFVTYATEDESEEAIRHMHGAQVGQKRLKVEYKSKAANAKSKALQ
jgi:RNA recognition motif-containing protein